MVDIWPLWMNLTIDLPTGSLVRRFVGNGSLIILTPLKKCDTLIWNGTVVLVGVNCSFNHQSRLREADAFVSEFLAV